MAPSTVTPETFTRAVAGLRAGQPRPQITLEEVPAPQRFAPYAYALSGTVLRDGDEVATGRLILLHDPAGHEAWHGTLRLVTYVTAELEPDLAADPTTADLEIRASWTPLDDDLSSHLDGWCALLASTAGLPPPGVTALPERVSNGA